MTAHEIFGQLKPDEAHEIFEEVSVANRDGYRACVQVTATRRKLRPIFLDKKPRKERHEWMRGVLAMPRNEDVGLEFLQTWLLGQHRPMIVEFLDACGVEHQEAIIEEIPPQPEVARLAAAVDGLLAGHAGVRAKVYLRVFQPEAEEAWPDLDRMLTEDSRLALG